MKTSPVNTVTFGFYAGTGRQEPMAMVDQHNEIELNFIEQGGMIFRSGDETVSVSAGEGIIYWAAVPHQVLEVKPKTTLTWLTVPLSWFLGWELPEKFTRRLLEGVLLRMPRELLCADDLGPQFNGSAKKRNIPRNVYQGTRFSPSGWARDYDSEAKELKVVIRLELEAFFRRLALGATKSSKVKLSAVAAGEEALSAGLTISDGKVYQCRHVERMVRYINEHFHEEISVKEIAGVVKLNPEYAMRLFHKRWGITLWRFLLTQRVSEARRLLLLSDMPLVDISLACGFQSLSRFYEAFKTECGCSPGFYRKKHTKAKTSDIDEH